MRFPADMKDCWRPPCGRDGMAGGSRHPRPSLAALHSRLASFRISTLIIVFPGCFNQPLLRSCCLRRFWRPVSPGSHRFRLACPSGDSSRNRIVATHHGDLAHFRRTIMHHITPLCKNSFHHNTAALLATDTYTGVVMRDPLREIREKQHSWENLARTRPVRPGCGTRRAGTYRYRGINIHCSPCCADNRAATVRESGPPTP